MFKKQIPKYLLKDLPMRISALLTCSAICYLTLLHLSFGIEFMLQLSAFISFYISFFIVTSTPPTHFPFKNKLLLLYQAVIALVLIRYDINYIVPTLLVFVATQLPIRFSRLHAFSIILFNSSIHFIILYDDPTDYAFNSIIIFLMLQFFGFFAVDSLLREEITKEELSTINKELLATRYMLKASSERKERLRISRDLHDTIGHQLTSLALNLEVSHFKVPDDCKPLLEKNRDQAKTLLSEVRAVVKEMRNAEQFDLVETFSALFDQLPKCELKVESIVEIHETRLKQQIMFCLQEAVSNAIRHGKADSFTLSATKKDKHLTFSLTDNGTALFINDFGSGLTGMKERLADFEGVIELLHTPNGCRLTIQAQDREESEFSL
jgi:signal transduction histidine kinase